MIDSEQIADDERWMQFAIQLALQGQGYVEPNPMVGCAIVHEGTLIGSGFHERFGGAHAEVNALDNVSREVLREATIYVTLEPCSHVGKTGPCVDQLIRVRPRRICIGCLDPNPIVNGTGVQKLIDAGIETTWSSLATNCAQLIAPFRKLVTKKKPYVSAKLGDVAGRENCVQNWAIAVDNQRTIVGRGA